MKTLLTNFYFEVFMTDIEIKKSSNGGSVVDIFSLRSTKITASKNESMKALRDKVDNIKRLGGSGHNVDAILSGPGF